jgi:hypothetical protein
MDTSGACLTTIVAHRRAAKQPVRACDAVPFQARMVRHTASWARFA